MIDSELKSQLLAELDRLSPEQLVRIYELARALAAPLPRGASVDELLTVSGTIDDESARQVTAAIDDAFERIDPREW